MYAGTHVCMYACMCVFIHVCVCVCVTGKRVVYEGPPQRAYLSEFVAKTAREVLSNMPEASQDWVLLPQQVMSRLCSSARRACAGGGWRVARGCE